MKRKKLFDSIILALVLFAFCSLYSSAYADEYLISQEEFEKGQLDGTISDDMTYDNFKISINNSKESSSETYLSNDNLNLDDVEVFDFGNNLMEPLYQKVKTLNPGDIFITNSTSSSGLTGHCGIAIGSDAILHIAGPGQPVSVGSKKAFYNKYIASDPDYYYMIIYRCNNYNYGRNAADWAVNVYRRNSANVTYKITRDLTTTYETYCSKIVFQSYYYGVGSSALSPNYKNIVRDGYIISPYNIIKILSGGSCSFNLVGDIQG